MKLHAIRIKNFRAFKDETILLDAHTVLVGPNGVGKSTVLAALNVLFREKEHSTTDTTWLDEQDFHKGNTKDPIEIVATFSDLNDLAKEDLSHYVRQEQLIVAAVAEYDPVSKRAEVKQFGERLGMLDFAPFFRAQGQGAKVAEQKEIYAKIREAYADLPPPGTGPAMIAALQDYEAQHPLDCSPLRSSDNFYGARKGRLDPYIQWVYVPAVKDARAEQVEGKTTALGKLLARTVRAKTNFDEQVEKVRVEAASAYEKLLEGSQGTLADISEALLKRLREWSHQDASLRLIWAQDADKSVRVEAPTARALAGEAGFQGDVARLGHGLQRSFILAILHELAETNDEQVPTLLLGVEEPELYQHPPQARHLASVLVKVSEGNSQVLLTTHSPFFASGQRFENVRMFRRAAGGEIVHSSATLDKVAEKYANYSGQAKLKPAGVRAKIHQILLWSLSEMFFASKVVFVEGSEDVAFLNYYMHATDRLDDLRAKGVAVVACSSKSGMIHAAAIANSLCIPFFLMWDSDGQEANPHRREMHRKDNLALLKISGVQGVEPFPEKDTFSDSYVCWKEEIASRLKVDVGEGWAGISDAAHNACGHAPNLGKNSVYISELIAACLEEGVALDGLENTVLAIRKFSGI
jgi:predicted ATPase